MKYYIVEKNIPLSSSRIGKGRWTMLAETMTTGDSVAVKTERESASLRHAFWAQKRRLQVRKQFNAGGESSYWRCWAA